MEKLAINSGKPIKKTMPIIRPLIDSSDKKSLLRTIIAGDLSNFEGQGLVGEFEKKFATFIHTKYAVAVNSGTAALHTALYAIGISPGDEVILPAFTFVSTASAIIQLGAIPVFAELETETLNIDPADIANKISGKTKAIIPVHMYGKPCKMEQITKIAKDNNLQVIEDCAQAHGARIGQKSVGSFGTAGCFSFAKSKNMTTGEGGLIATDNEKVFELCKLIRQNGKESWKVHKMLGFNYRMTEMQAAIGLSQLKKLEKMNKKRQEYAKIYLSELENLGFVLPTIEKETNHVFYKFPILVPEKYAEKRDFFVKAVRAENIPIESGYSTPLYEIPFIKERLNRDYSLPNTESVAKRIVNLPTAPSLTKKDILDTCKALKKVCLNVFS